eukprot:Rhum_TRINITY_DN14437_c6_g1::Rhum_TRINITY_DN14437_c6_g1_i1::g.89655::m.89655
MQFLCLLTALPLPPGLHGKRKPLQAFLRLVETDALVRDGLSVLQASKSVLAELLRSELQVRLEHHAGNGAAARLQLLGDVLYDARLVDGLLARVAVRAVDDETLVLHLLLLQRRTHRLHVLGRVVGARGGAAQDDVAERVAHRVHDGGQALLRHRQESVRVLGGLHGVAGNLHVARRAVLEADRHRQAARQLAVDLRLGGACADGAPRDAVGEELRGDGVEELAAARQAQLVDLHEKLAGQAQALVDLERVVQVRVVDQTLPADRRPRLLEVDAHDDDEVAAQLLLDLLQLARVLHRRLRVVDRARADDHDEPVVGAAHGVRASEATLDDGVAGGVGEGDVVKQDARRQQRLQLLDAQVVNRLQVVQADVGALAGGALLREDGHCCRVGGGVALVYAKAMKYRYCS